MGVRTDQRAPYASTSSVTQVIEKHRQVRLQQIDTNTLSRIGVKESLIPRTLQAMPLLGFYDESGRVTPEFDELCKATEEDFKPRLAALLRTAYADVLAVVGDPATASQQEIENAFRGFTPTGQIGRMVQLFIGLFTYADVRSPDATAKVRRPASSRATMATAKPKPTPAGGRSSRGEQNRVDGPASPPPPPPPSPPPAAAAGDGYQTVVKLGAAGTLTLIVDMNPWQLTGTDRDFFNELVDRINAYAARSKPSPTENGAAIDDEINEERVS